MVYIGGRNHPLRGELGVMPVQQEFSPGHRLVSTVCAQLHRAYHNIRFYPPGHPSVLGTLDSLTETLLSYLSENGRLVLEVEEEQLLHEGERVYAHESSRDNLAFLMFRDGIRSLALDHGLEKREIVALAECLARADDMTDIEHDLVTRLWEQDFAHIDYRVADPFLGGEVLREGTIDALREAVLRRLDEVASTGGAQAGMEVGDLKSVEQAELDLADLRLSAQELEQAEKAVEDSPDLIDDFRVVLLELRARISGPCEEDDPLLHALATVVETHIDGRNLQGLESTIAELQRTEAEGRGPAGFLGLVLGQAVTAQGVGGLLAGPGQEAPEDAARVDGLLASIRPWIAPALLEALAVAEDRSVRKTLLTLLEAEGGVSWQHLVPLLGDARWYVVRNAVQLAAGIREPELLKYLERVARYPDVRVRRELMRTLETFEDHPGALRVLGAAVADEDSSVRTLAVGSLGRRGGREHGAPVLAQIEAHDFDGRQPEEIEAFLVAFARLVKEEAVPTLDKLWRRRRFSARPAPVRLAALRTLGTIPGALSQRALSDAAKSREGPIRKAAARALQEAKHQARGSQA